MNCINKNMSPAFFLGANTPEGFYSLFSELYYPEEGWRLFIIKGGPGTGKSSLMKEIAATADRRGIFCERIYCSSDEKSLDGVIIPGLKVSIADGTPPHTLEARFPGVSEKFVDLGAYRNDEILLQSKDEIIAKTLENSLEHKKCVSFLRAALISSEDSRLLLNNGVDRTKLEKTAVKLADSTVKTISSEKGRVYRRFLNALTPSGNTLFYSTFTSLCERKILLKDDFGIAAPFILGVIKEKAANSGLDVIECCDYMNTKNAVQLIIPDLSLGFFTEDRYRTFDGEYEKCVHCNRFCCPSVFREHKNRISFNSKSYAEFLTEACAKLKNAKTIHDELEKYYVNAMNFEGVKMKTLSLCREIFGTD